MTDDILIYKSFVMQSITCLPNGRWNRHLGHDFDVSY